VIRLAADISGAFPDEAAVNEALRDYLSGRLADRPAEV